MGLTTVLVLISACLSCTVLCGSLNNDEPKKAKVNFLMDLQLKNLNLETPANKTSPDFQIGNVSGKGVSISGMNTFERVGDAYIWTTSDNNLYNHVVMKLGDLVIQVDQLTYEGDVGNVSFRVKENALELDYSITYFDDGCRMDIQRLEVIKLSDVRSCSDNPKFHDKDVSDMFEKLVRPALNEKLNSKEFQAKVKNLQAPFCTHV